MFALRESMSGPFEQKGICFVEWRAFSRRSKAPSGFVVRTSVLLKTLSDSATEGIQLEMLGGAPILDAARLLTETAGQSNAI